jgi:mono/diheme cytochrome c family protein
LGDSFWVDKGLEIGDWQCGLCHQRDAGARGGFDFFFPSGGAPLSFITMPNAYSGFNIVKIIP